MDEIFLVRLFISCPDGKEEQILDRARKEELVGELHDKFNSAEAVFLMEYRGITVGDLTKLRRELRDASVEFKVVRNTFAKIALGDTPIEEIKDQFVGPVAVAFSTKDAAAAAKALKSFSKEEPKLKFKLGTLGAKVLQMSEIDNLATLPSRDELLAKLVGSLNGVPTSLVGVLSGVPRKLLYTLKAIGPCSGSGGTRCCGWWSAG
jgi:large subunit ribosomal protein L10